MKSIIIFGVFILVFSNNLFAQNVGISEDGSSPDSSAILDLKTTNKGLLLPRLSSMQIAHIQNPAEGLIVYNLDNRMPVYFDGVDWRYCDGSMFFVIPVNGLVAYYPFNGNASDESGNGNNGTLMHTVTGVADRLGNTNSALMFDGDLGYISVPNSASLQSVTTAFTFSVRIKIIAWYNVDCCALILCKNNLSTENMRFFITPGAMYYSGEKFIGLSEGVTLNQWHHFLVTSDGSMVKFYQNGNYLGECQMDAALVANTAILEIGRDIPGGSIDYLNGVLDDLRIYNRAFTPHEVQAIFNEQ